MGKFVARRIEAPRPPNRQRITWKTNNEDEVLRRTQTGGIQKSHSRKVTLDGSKIRIEKDFKEKDKEEQDLREILQRKGQDFTQLYIRYGFNSNTENSLMKFLILQKPREITKSRITVDKRFQKGVWKYRFVEFLSPTKAHYAKLHIEQNFNVFVDFAQQNQRNKKDLNIGPPKGHTPENGATEFSICGFPFSFSRPPEFSMNIPGLNPTPNPYLNHQQRNKALIPSLLKKKKALFFMRRKIVRIFVPKKLD